MPITLTVTEGPHIGRQFCFQGHDAFLVGRSKHAHFRLPRHDMYFSRIHFLVEVNPPRCCLIDMGSCNGTRINGRRASPGWAVELYDGDRIEGGDTVIHVAILPDEVPAIHPAAAEERPPANAAIRRPKSAPAAPRGP